MAYFNPRPHKGDDQQTTNLGLNKIISIHVPTRGTTRCEVFMAGCTTKFQSTSPQGGRQVIKGQSRRLVYDFNPRPHKGDDDHPHLLIPTIIQHFNPRPHKGDDPVILNFICGVFAFQSTSPQGGRHKQARKFLYGTKISIHVPTRGTTPRVHRYTQWAVYFNPRPHKGDDRREQIVKP